MAVTQADDGSSVSGRFKAAAPAAGAVGIIAAIVGISVFANQPAQISDPVSAPATSGPATSGPAPDSLPGLATPQDEQQGSGSFATGVEIVVKFKNDGAVKDIIDAFWRDQAAGKTRFNAWKAGRPEFAGLALDRVTYSNELVLVHDGSVPAPQRAAAMRSIATRLGAASDISYAEPNMTAHPGGQ